MIKVQCATTLILKCIHQGSRGLVISAEIEIRVSEGSVRKYNESLLDKSAAGV